MAELWEVAGPDDVSPLVRPGSLVAGKYRIEALLGRGGMGSVFRALHLSLSRAVALKVISPRLARSPDARRRFENEAKAVARIRSRHVVEVFDSGELEDGTPFIAMELLEGEPLSKRLHREGALPLPVAGRILTQVGRALTRAHELGIVHRDLKPENIFLVYGADEAGGDDGLLVKVLDFGIAKLVQVSGDESGLTHTGAAIGTPSYMSPEQARGRKDIDVRSDLYSLGLVAFTIVTGRRAFSAETVGDYVFQVFNEGFPSARATRPDLPVAIEAWFARACAVELGERFSSAKELVDAFASTIAGAMTTSAPKLATTSAGSVPATRIEVVTPGAPALRRPPRGADAIADAEEPPSLTAAPTASATLSDGSSDAQTGRGRVAPVSSRRRWLVAGLALLVPAAAIATILATSRDASLDGASSTTTETEPKQPAVGATPPSSPITAPSDVELPVVSNAGLAPVPSAVAPDVATSAASQKLPAKSPTATTTKPVPAVGSAPSIAASAAAPKTPPGGACALSSECASGVCVAEQCR
jgi:serine/threonine-protein kinase